MRLIDTDAVKLPKGFFEKADNVPKFYDWLNSLSVIDAVPVVRCKHCKYQNKGQNESETWNLCGYRPWQYTPTTDEHFCGYAERRTDETD